MYDPSTINDVLRLAEEGLNKSQISRRTGVSRSAIRSWLGGELPHSVTGISLDRRALGGCPDCGAAQHDFAELPAAPYAYLLGLYLGDGCISEQPKPGVYSIRIALALEYTTLLMWCIDTMREVLPNRVGLWIHPRHEVAYAYSYSKQLPCLFPQHGPGRKHERPIALTPWQEQIVDAHPEQLLRGLIHSDGCRSRNFVNGKNYPRYLFCNHSDDIRDIFCRYCDRLGIEWRQMNRWNISVARRDSVAKLDAFIGPKR